MERRSAAVPFSAITLGFEVNPLFLVAQRGSGNHPVANGLLALGGRAYAKWTIVSTLARRIAFY